MLDTYLKLCTEYYEIAHPTAPQDMLDFYLSYASNPNISILEPMCGSGRFLIPFLEAGLNVHGFDASEFMLEELREKCAKKNLSLKAWNGYIQDLDQAEQYDFIFIPSGSFCLVTQLAEAKRSLEKIFTSLKTGGYYVFEAETLKACPSILEVWKGSEVTKPDGNKILLSKMDLPMNDQILTTVFRYDLINGSEIVKSEVEHFPLRLYDPKELTNMLEETGFSSVRIVPNPDKAQAESEEVVIFECKK